MSSNELQVEELKRENAERPKVAFSVGLTDAGAVGPFTTDITLKFSKIFTNIGQAYNPSTVLEARMSSSENEVEELKRENIDLLARVTGTENKCTVLEARMSSNENEVEELKRENA
eukprot:superscaffoldBa00007550_g22638